MSGAGIFAAVVLILISLLTIAYPLFSKQIALGEEARRKRNYDELVTSYERIVATIRDLDEDFRTRKLNESDYRPEREQWVLRGVSILQQIEQIGPLPQTIPQANAATESAPEIATTDDQVEAAIARYMDSMKEVPSTN